MAEQWVDGLGERDACLVGGNVPQADGIAGEDFAGVAGDGQAVVLPADAAHREPGYLVAALAGEQPGQCDGADEFDRIGAAVRSR
ncbi:MULTISPECIES: hypothetical protein [unclassified Streptomyces]|uniref:hypothetical protein n=1 Tax=unclassified Streptomyces TaxID=2593676 RepID=UPI0035E31B88